jgi:hypothetical protein
VEVTSLENSLKHECFQLKQSYKEFQISVGLNKQQKSPEIQFIPYSSYSLLIQHLYESLKAKVAIDVSKTKSEKNEFIEEFIQQMLINTSDRFSENSKDIHIQAQYLTFAKQLRVHRNKVSGHVLANKFSDFSLSKFFGYNCYVVRLMQLLEEEYSTELVDIVNKEAIQEFSIRLTCDQGEW